MITPESERQVRPFVDAIIARAPVAPPWEFYPYRMPEDLSLAILTVHGRTGVDITEWGVEAVCGEFNLVDLNWILPSGSSPSDASSEAAFVAIESLLGEEVLDTWIGKIEAIERPRAGFFGRFVGRSKPVPAGDESPAKLKSRVESIIATIRGDLPAQPQAAIDDPSGGALFKLEPRQRADYPGQLDLIVAGSRGLPGMWNAAHSKAPFASVRFSRHGETFCYLKFDTINLSQGSIVAERAKLEDELDALLRPNALGSVIGGGTGLRYGYIDLAIANLDRGLAEVRRLAREFGVHKRSWLLFFDAQWRDEWIGIFEDSPPPPQVD